MLEVTDYGITPDGWRYVETSDGTRYLKATDSRVLQLEQLCRDMYIDHSEDQEWHGNEPDEDFTHRMEALGLLEVD